MQVPHPLAGKPAPSGILVSIPQLITAYYTEIPDATISEQQVKFGTSGHRGSSFEKGFNEWHIVSISQAICDYRKQQGIDGPLFLGIDTHALSIPAYTSAIEVLAANGVAIMLAEGDEYTPTPVISHAILTYNRNLQQKRGNNAGLSDGIVITPSHNPPSEGGFKYNPPTGGPADPTITRWIEEKANDYMRNGLVGVKRVSLEKGLKASTTHRYSYMEKYVDDLIHVIDMKSICDAKLKIGVDPLGGAGVHYWERIAEKYHLDLTVVSDTVDPTFRFMTCDGDGKIRMDPSSPYAMQRLIHLKDLYQVAFACDTDHDRHGIVTRSAGLLPPNHYLSAAIDYLFRNRPLWSKKGAVGKTLVSSRMIDFVSQKLGRKVYEVPVGFKWFVEGLLDGSLLFVGEESAGASFARLDGSVWTTDKDGITAALLSAEMTARTGKDPGEIYQTLSRDFGTSFYDRFESPASKEQREKIQSLTPEQVHLNDLAGEKILAVITHAPGNDQPIGGIKVVAETGWFVIRPSGTEDIYRIYVESFKGKDEMLRILEQAQSLVDQITTRGTKNG